MQSNGSLQETDLRTLLESAQTERATGTLTVRNGNGGACTLYFLFGHLFHALGEGVDGDDAVVKALGWSSGEFDFDAKAKLPADETVRGSISELIDRAGSSSNGQGPAAEAPAEAPVEAPAAPEPRAEQAPPPPAPSERPRERERGREPDAMDTQERRGVKHRPQPKHGREPIPVPAGQVTYDSLKTSFVDFPRLITTLEREAYTGYVRLLTDDAAGLILFKEGMALECAYDIGAASGVSLGSSALMDFNDEVTRGHGVLDVVALSPELVDGLYEMTVTKPMYSDLYAAWVDPKALLKFLEQRKLSGSVMVRAQRGTGVIILTNGKLSGAYTSDSRDIADSTDGVLDLCSDPEAVLEVKAADQSPRAPLDVESVVGGRATAAPPPPPAAPAPPPPPPAEPPGGNSADTQPTMAAFTPAEEMPPPAAPEPSPFATAPPTPAAPAEPGAEASNVDWEAVINDLQQLTEDALGNRSRKVKDVLAAADRSQAGVEAAIDQVPTISILFVDSSRLEALANDLKARLRTYTG
ncbi:MAG TPA: DUF4388 domain-containing protein [Candidatus Dormibacteraeota bacterium]